VRDALAQFNALGTDAVGISPDPVAVQKGFSDKLVLNFPLLSDADHAVAEAYGVWGEKSLYGKKYFGVTRSAFLIDERGQILAAWPKISPAETVTMAMETLHQL
jgi:peroxiredoxin Q/BCP